MKFFFFRNSHRSTLRCLCFCVLALGFLPALADENAAADPVIKEHSVSPCEFELRGTEELCGWADLVTHDSVAIPTPAPPTPAPPVPVPPVPALPENSEPIPPLASCTFDTSVTVLAAVACASTGVSVEQIVEPFAMVGPYLDNSLDAVSRLQDWWGVAVQEAESLRASDIRVDEIVTSDLQSEADVLAGQQPIEIEAYGPSILLESLAIETNLPSVAVEKKTAAAGKLAGSSPIIVTIEEAYLPYDLSAKDIKLWSVFPIATQPFCIRSRADAFDDRPMWKNVVEVAQAEIDAIKPAERYEFSGSADCYLDELIWKLDCWNSDDSPLWDTLQPRNIGRRIAGFVSGSQSLFEEAAEVLAAHWPQNHPQVQPSRSGEALLARAGAVESYEPIVAVQTSSDGQVDAQIAESVTPNVLR